MLSCLTLISMAQLSFAVWVESEFGPPIVLGLPAAAKAAHDLARMDQRPRSWNSLKFSLTGAACRRTCSLRPGCVVDRKQHASRATTPEDLACCKPRDVQARGCLRPQVSATGSSALFKNRACDTLDRQTRLLLSRDTSAGPANPLA